MGILKGKYFIIYLLKNILITQYFLHKQPKELYQKKIHVVTISVAHSLSSA